MKILNIILTVFLIIGIVVLGILISADYTVKKHDEILKSQIGETEDFNHEIIKKDRISGFVAGESLNLTDTMIYFTYDVKSGKISYMSIPRDTYTESPYAWGDKLNAIYRGRNINELVNEIEYLLDVNIDYYLVVDMDIIKTVVDLLGGVEVDVPFRMFYTDNTQNLHIDLHPGKQILDGNKSEQFIRWRKNNGGVPTPGTGGDIERMERQQYFITRLLKTAASADNILKLPEIANTVFKNIKTNASLREGLRYISDIPNIKLDEIYTASPVIERNWTIDFPYLKLNLTATRKIIKENF